MAFLTQEAKHPRVLMMMAELNLGIEEEHPILMISWNPPVHTPLAPPPNLPVRLEMI